MQIRMCIRPITFAAPRSVHILSSASGQTCQLPWSSDLGDRPLMSPLAVTADGVQFADLSF